MHGVICTLVGAVPFDILGIAMGTLRMARLLVGLLELHRRTVPTSSVL